MWQLSLFSFFWPLCETKLLPPFITSLYQSVNHTSLGFLQNLYDCKSGYCSHVFVPQCLVPLCRHTEIHALRTQEQVQVSVAGFWICATHAQPWDLHPYLQSRAVFIFECTETWLDHYGLWWSRESRAVSARSISSWWKLRQPGGCSSLTWSSAWS